MTDREFFDIIKQNVKEYYYDKSASPYEIIADFKEDGSFKNLDYVKQDWTLWGPHIHLLKLKNLSCMYACPESASYKDSRIKECIHKGLKYFFDGNFVSDNWWMNDIGVPTECGTIRLMFREDLTEVEDAFLAKYAAGNPKTPRLFSLNSNADSKGLRPYASQGMHVTSQLVDTHFQLAIDDPAPEIAMKKVRECIEQINIEHRVVMYPATKSPSGKYGDEHCIKTDYSYHEHENEFTHNGYGTGIIQYMIPLYEFWKGTDLKPDDVAVREYINLLLDGFDNLCYKGTLPMTTMGRDAGNATRPHYRNPEYVPWYIKICDILLEWGKGYRSDELEFMKKRFSEPETTPHFDRNKYFWHSDYISHNRKDFHFSVHAVSNRIKRPESILSKNVKGMFLGDGCYNILVNGFEYDEVQPFIDWHKLPGTTVTCGDIDLNPECEIDTKIDTLRIFGGAKGTTAFVGGVSDGMNGMFCYDYDHLHVKAKKTWFCFNNKIVCLGAGITADDDNGACTTLNQCNLINENVIVNGKNVCDGSYNLSDVKYVYSDNVGYVFLQKENNVELITGNKKGKWSDIDTASGSDEEREKRIFLLGINHGEKPVDASYAYVMIPNATPEDINDHCIEIVSNTSECQAVWSEELNQLQAVFYKENRVKVKGFTIEANKPCTLMVTFIGGDYEVWVSNPEHEKATVNVKLNNNTITFDLEEGYMLNNLGRPLGYSSKDGFKNYTTSQLESLGENIYKRY